MAKGKKVLYGWDDLGQMELKRRVVNIGDVAKVFDDGETLVHGDCEDQYQWFWSYRQAVNYARAELNSRINDAKRQLRQLRDWRIAHAVDVTDLVPNKWAMPTFRLPRY